MSTIEIMAEPSHGAPPAPPREPECCRGVRRQVRALRRQVRSLRRWVLGVTLASTVASEVLRRIGIDKATIVALFGGG